MQRAKLIILMTALVLGFLFKSQVGAEYIPNNKDTRLPPKEISIGAVDLSGFQLLKETKNYNYYFKEERDIIAIWDKRIGYVWKTGIDEPFPNDVYRACDLAQTEEEKREACIDVIHRLNTKYIGMANSLITVEYFVDPNQTDFISSASSNNAQSTLQSIEEDDSHYILDVNFSKPDIQLQVHIFFSDKGITYQIHYDEITGEDKERIAGIIITPFLGAEGGQYLKYDFEARDYDFSQPIRNKVIPGYVLVPDGPGALIRFKDYDTRLSVYTGKVYGNDNSLNTMYYSGQRGFVAYKQPVLPVFGIAHGNRQAAFVAYVTEGDEQLEILMFPDEQRNMSYNLAYPYFVYNRVYYQVYNQAGAGYNKLLDGDQKPIFDIKIHYEFLSGDGSEDGRPADYVGMAKAYRDYLLESGIITLKEYDYSDIAARIDFLMADAQQNIFGFEDVVVTTIHDVEEILKGLQAAGIKNINSGLLGFQKGGLTLGNPGQINFSRQIGTREQFRTVIASLKELGIDVSLHQDFAVINEEQMRLWGNALRHATGWYTRTFLYDAESPIDTVYYARADRAVDWILSHKRKLETINPSSITIDGIQSILFSDYTEGLRSRKMTIALYQETLGNITGDYKMNAKNPNQYLWQYIDRYLEAPVFTSQFLVETDTVPFLQLVLNGTMEMYAPYSNFSFYTDQDILRMIDYNVYPSFILTEKPAYLLMATNSANYYSTEYELYKPLITAIYGQVNEALGSVINSEWVDRTVIANGVIVNRYSNGTEIVVNYTDRPVVYNLKRVEPVSFKVVPRGGK